MFTFAEDNDTPSAIGGEFRETGTVLEGEGGGIDSEEVVEEYEVPEEEKPPNRRKAAKKVTSSMCASGTSASAFTEQASIPAKTKSAARSRVQGRLKNIMSMPLDVLFEIFSALLPADLLSLARTSKNIRQVLMNRNHSGLWKAARANAPGLPSPDPPADMSEPAWARLIYGGSACYSCSAKNIQRIDFGLRRRACVKCKKAFLVWKSRFNSVCGGMDASLMDLVGYTNVSAHSHGHGSKNRYYWKPDLVDMERRLKELENGEDGTNAVREFRVRKKAVVSEAMKRIPALVTWVLEAENYKLQERSSAEEENYHTAVARLKAAGYEERDIPAWGIRSMLHGKPVLNEAAWGRIFPKMEFNTIGSRNARHAREERERLGKRSRTAAWLYRDYLHTLVPVQWRYLPTPEHLVDNYCRDIPSFKRLVELNEEPILKEEWNDAVAALPEELSAYLVSRLAPIAQAFPDLTEYPTSFHFALASEGSDPATLDAISARFSCLDLAKAVFRSDTYQWATGYDAVYFQDKWRCRDTFATFCSEGASAVESIIQLVGNLSNSVTAVQLDESCGTMHLRCATCSAKSEAISMVYVGWRTYLNHCMDVVDALHQPEILPIDPHQVDTPLTTHKHTHMRWACTHCPDWHVRFSAHSWYDLSPSAVMEEFVAAQGRVYFALGSFDDLIKHNQEKHEIEDPQENYDFFYYASPCLTRPVTIIRA